LQSGNRLLCECRHLAAGVDSSEQRYQRGGLLLHASDVSTLHLESDCVYGDVGLDQPGKSSLLMKMRKTGTGRARGSVLVMFMFMVIPIVAMVGFVADLGWYYQTEQAATKAAEAAAVAVVRAAMDNVAAGGSYTCGSHGTVCQAATACSTPTSFTNNVQSGCTYVAANGFSQSGLNGRQSASIETGTTTPAPTVPGVKVLYWATVRVSQTNPLTFLAVLGAGNLGLTIRSTAAVVNKIPNNCVTALNPSASSSVVVSGSSTVTLSGCAAQVNSDDPKALDLNGGGCLDAGSIQVVGGVNGADTCASSPPVTGVPSISDPFGSVAPPVFSPTCDYNNKKVNSGATVTLSPGVYCGGLSVSATVSLSPGTYVLEGGGLTCNASCNMSGTGVTIYNTCNSGSCGGGRSGYQPISIGGQAVLDLTAPTSGPLAGMLFFQDRTVSPTPGQTDSIQGGANANLYGVLYFPKSTLTFAGGFSSPDASTIIVADQVKFSGNSNMQISKTGPTPAWAATAALID
jgi:Flp pilus assembly protein TadG